MSNTVMALRKDTPRYDSGTDLVHKYLSTSEAGGGLAQIVEVRLAPKKIPVSFLSALFHAQSNNRHAPFASHPHDASSSRRPGKCRTLP